MKPKLAVYSHIVTGPGGDDELSAKTRQAYDGPFVIGEDLMSFEVGDEVRMVSGPP